ncbi:hypothetical protein BKA67DRAFT_644057 [Truncatella angustata]|uniref:Uncharacterized protein n=1 Tax=Truncatella angustata TaxID=152316 RepID=A0A9P9A0C0_9PEZI|nr:uncharacterized protein BKA67DRAFT_644057 [Truncatella angustata]KAH6658187.1 hypothetical protein BKA67DRAFT_644057 [Truncatella angustata]
MRSSMFVLAATAVSSALAASFTVDFFDGKNECSGDSKSTEIDFGSDVFKCVEANGIGVLQVSGEDLNECGPFYSDSNCNTVMVGSEPFACDSCIGYSNAWFIVEQEL